MKPKTPKFAIIDIETTGGIATRDKITEIGLIIVEDGEVIDQFESLINPERSIPYEITRITGITNEMVEGAPKFYELAKDIILKTEGCIFVAHNVHFDYGFIKQEFQNLGYTYSRKKLCTLQLSRRFFRGLKSYSLGNLIQHFDIAVKDRHRAMEDAKATLVLFQKIMLADHTGEFIERNVPELLAASKLPPTIKQETIQLLPERSGVYYMLDYTLRPLYIGKSKNIKDRIIIATFSSNVHRIQQVIDTAHKYNRKVAVLGRSMVNVSNISAELGYLNIPDGVLIDIDEINNYPPSNIVIITTGSQGEPMSALTRMSTSDHRKVGIVPGDTVIISATPIPGNEKLVSRTIDNLLKQGANVIYEKTSGIHVSGHASQEELKLIHNLVRPKFFIPVHGEYRHLRKHAMLAQDLGMPKENVFVAENGNIIEFTKEKGGIVGKVPSGIVLVDGLGVGDVGNIVLRDRRQLSQDGILIIVVTMDKEMGAVVAGPDIVSRGFVYVRESEELMEEAKEKVKMALEKCEDNNITEWAVIKSNVRDALGRYLYERTRRRPMILPIIMEI